MKKNIQLLLLSCPCFLLISCGSNHVLKEVRKLEQYPSASAIEYFRDRFYVMGDDATYLLVLDSNWQQADSIPLFSSKERRIPKSVKPDLESMTAGWKNNGRKLLLFGSGSVMPNRNLALWIDPPTGKVDSVRLDTVYNQLLENGLKELNIEGMTSIPGNLLLANRGHKGYPVNQLIFLPWKNWSNPSSPAINIARIGGNSDSLSFKGVSGLAYSTRSDQLIMTVSTEDTRNALDDGAIGKSYLWFIKNISGKKRWRAINPDKIIELDGLDARFRGQKIESVCITKETRNFFHLVLAADNDDGSSTLFRLIVEK